MQWKGIDFRNAIDLNPANQDEIFRSCAIIEDSENITGTVTVTIDGKEVYKKTFNNNGTQLGHCLKLS